MKPRQTVEKYWSVWILVDDGVFPGPYWEPFDEGMTEQAARNTLRSAQEKNPLEKYALVHTVNTRLRTTQARGGK